MREYLSSKEVKYTASELQGLEETLIQCASKCKMPKSSLKNIRNMAFRRPARETSQLCFDLAGVDPFSEQYGTKSRQEFEKER